MGFNGFVGVAGIDNYFGLDEYPSQNKDYDGCWGIFDEPYLQYFANELNTKKEPFFSSLFTVSSHHPYTIPEQHIDKFPKGDLPLHETVGYTDYALQRFFNASKKMRWFNNTIFVFTADHSTQSNNLKYKTRLGRYAVPLFIYDPTGNLKGEHTKLIQHADISPTILGLVGRANKIISFGNDAFSEKAKFAVQYINGSYQLTTKDHFIIFDGEKITNYYALDTDSLLENNLLKESKLKTKDERLIKGIIQQYNNRLINNQLSISNIKSH
jgi:phosphoglycerol transferase MdoB-like AlkP superfamily enzyme